MNNSVLLYKTGNIPFLLHQVLYVASGILSRLLYNIISKSSEPDNEKGKDVPCFGMPHMCFVLCPIRWVKVEVKNRLVPLDFNTNTSKPAHPVLLFLLMMYYYKILSSPHDRQSQIPLQLWQIICNIKYTQLVSNTTSSYTVTHC